MGSLVKSTEAKLEGTLAIQYGFRNSSFPLPWLLVVCSVQSKKEEELMKSSLLKIHGKVNTLPQFKKIYLMVITAFTRPVGSLCFMLHFPMEMNICECFGLELVLL